MPFEMLFISLIAFIFGFALTFIGYRFFLLLLPIWGFIFGFVLGAQAIQVVLGIGFLSTVTSWVVGFVAGTAFAVLSYLFYAVAVGVIAGSLGYILAAGFLGLLGITGSFLVFTVGIVAAFAMIGVTFAFNLQKYVIIIATAFIGATISVATLSLGATGASLLKLAENPVQLLLRDSPLLVIVYVALVIAGIVVQIKANENFEIEAFENKI